MARAQNWTEAEARINGFENWILTRAPGVVTHTGEIARETGAHAPPVTCIIRHQERVVGRSGSSAIDAINSACDAIEQELAHGKTGRS